MPRPAKFSDEELSQVFTGEHRANIGKVELSIPEITEILNDEILTDTTVTENAVRHRMKKVVGTQFGHLDSKLTRTEHGGRYFYVPRGQVELLAADGGQPTETEHPALKLENTVWIITTYGFAAYALKLYAETSEVIFAGFAAATALVGVFATAVFHRLNTTGVNLLYRLGEWRE